MTAPRRNYAERGKTTEPAWLEPFYTGRDEPSPRIPFRGPQGGWVVLCVRCGKRGGARLLSEALRKCEHHPSCEPQEAAA